MRGISILIAEDEEEIADLIAILLEKGGYNVSKVSDGQEAVHAVETQSFDLLILDIMMPKMNGYEVTEQELSVNVNEEKYTVSYYPISQRLTIKVPVNQDYEISGNNMDSVIVTVYE